MHRQTYGASKGGVQMTQREEARAENYGKTNAKSQHLDKRYR